MRARIPKAATAAAAMVAGLIGAAAPPAWAAPTSFSNATLEWDWSEYIQFNSAGGCFPMVAGPVTATTDPWVGQAGNVTIYNDGAPATDVASLCAGGTSRKNQKMVWTGGTGTVDPDTGAGTLTFTGSLTVGYNTYITLTNVVVDVTPSGVGTVKATLTNTPAPPASGPTPPPYTSAPLQTFVDVTGLTGVSPTGYSATPAFSGVTTTGADSTTKPSDCIRGIGIGCTAVPGWGSWPQPFITHQGSSTESFFYTTGTTTANTRKPPNALLVTYGEPDAGPVVPEVPLNLLLPLAGGGVLLGGAQYLRRRQQPSLT